MRKNTKVLITTTLLSIFLLSSCTNGKSQETKADDTTTKALDPQVEDILNVNSNIIFTIKNEDEIVGTTSTDSNPQKNADIIQIVTKDYMVDKINLYENFSELPESTDLVVMYAYNKKMYLASYKDGVLDYIPTPSEKLIDKVYAYENFGTYKSKVFPNKLLDILYNAVNQNDTSIISNYAVQPLSSSETVSWVDYYNKHNNNQGEFYIDSANVSDSYKFDFNNDNIEDIIFIDKEGADKVSFVKLLQGNGDDTYSVVVDHNLYRGYHDVTPISYKGKNYLINSYLQENNPLDSISAFYITSDNTSNGTSNLLQVADINRYSFGYNITNTSTTKGYDNFADDYMIDRLKLANIATYKVMGTAETNVEIVPTTYFGDGYSPTSDYTNNGTDDTIIKMSGHEDITSIWFVKVDSEDKALSNTIHKLINDGGFSPLSIFLDKTEYGNILFIANGYNSNIHSLNAYKITGEETELVGTVNLESINHVKVEFSEFSEFSN